MFGHRDTSPGYDEGRSSGNIEGPLGVAAGAAHVDGIYREGHRNHFLTHGLDKAGDFIGRFTLRAQRHQEAGDLHIAQCARHDANHHVSGLVHREVLMAQDTVQQVFHDGPMMKFSIICSPCSVRMDSG